MQGDQGPPHYGQPQYGQQPQSAGPLASQFGQMGLGGKPAPAMVSTTNLVGLPLNPAELFEMAPPEIRLPANVRTRATEPESRRADDGYAARRPPSPRARTGTAIPRTSAPPSTPSLPPTPFSTSRSSPSLSSSLPTAASSLETCAISYSRSLHLLTSAFSG